MRRPFGPHRRPLVHQVRNAKVDDLHRVIVENKEVRRLQVPVDQPRIVGGLQAPANLQHHVHYAFRRQPAGLLLDDLVERHAWKHRHHQVRPRHAPLFVLADIADIDDVGVVERREHLTFFFEELKTSRVVRIANRLHRHFGA